MPRTPHKYPGNEEQWEVESNYGKYEHIEPKSPDSDVANEALLRKIGHAAQDTPVSLGFQKNGGTPSKDTANSQGDEGTGKPSTPLHDTDKWGKEGDMEPTLEDWIEALTGAAEDTLEEVA